MRGAAEGAHSGCGGGLGTGGSKLLHRESRAAARVKMAAFGDHFWEGPSAWPPESRHGGREAMAHTLQTAFENMAIAVQFVAVDVLDRPQGILHDADMCGQAQGMRDGPAAEWHITGL